MFTRYIVHDINDRVVTKHFFKRYAEDVRNVLNAHSKADTYRVKKVSK